MAYQPKSYRKFLAGSVSAALVATAVGPVVANAASFSDVNPNDSHAANINALVELGYIKGFADGTFKPYQSITRGQVAKIFARILTDQGFKAPDKIEQVFDDVPLDAKDQELVKAAAIVKAAGVMTGSQGKLNPAQNITREQMAKVLVEAFDLTRPADFKSKITDLDKADPSFRDYIQTLEANGVTVVTEYRPKDSVTRAAFASFVKRALDVQEAAKAPKVESVSAIGAKKLEVKFNKAVDDTKAKFEVKKGSVTVNVGAVTFSEDKKSAYIELSSKLTEGEYTVNVTGLEKTLTATYKAENEKVSKIEILSDKAVADKNVTKVTVAYKVYNQYGEDITKFTTLNATSSNGTATPNPTKGLIEITSLAGGTKLGDTLSLTLIHVDTATTATAKLTISDAAYVSDVSIEKLYNEDNKELTADETNVNDFMLLVDVKDQYGNTLDKAAAQRDLIVRVSDTNVVSVDGYNAATNTANFDTVQIDGKERTVLRLNGGLKPGKSTITLISKYTGKSASYEVEVKEGVKANTITLSQPELAVAGETVTIPFEATDMYGNALTKTSVLNRDVTFTVSAGTGNWTPANVPKFEVGKDGKAVLKLAIPADAKGKVSITAITANQKVSTLSFDVKEVAKPVAIIGFEKDVYTNVLKGEKLTFKASDLIAEDQYGRKISGDDLVAKLGDTSNPQDGDLFVAISEGNDSGGAIGNLTVSRIGGKGTTSTVVDGLVRGNETLTFSLVKYDSGSSTYKPVAGSDFDATIKTVELNDIVSYDVKDISKLYDEVGNGKTNDTDYNYTVEVYGKLANGSKVFVPQRNAANTENYYTVTTNSVALKANGAVLDVDSTGNPLPYDTGKKDITLKVTVTINHTGETISKDVVVSKEAPKVASAAFDVDATAVSVSKEDTGYLVMGSVANVDDAADYFGILEIEDQYGVDATIAADGTVKFADDSTAAVKPVVTFSNIVDGKADATAPKVTGNGTSSAAFSAGLGVGDSFTTTITFPTGVSTSARVIVK
ncbi:S-layer homology domain-containing protein [Parageobacillus thermoglucosidasius]|uniref:S-layer homology domain-containing protein n=1 Tax=Parageobacillus thermoglucosidasius TaxID=1426 RepID=UPI000E163CFB|nr:S-layer homology domain-containing protein [Parageobacillus thermoglucosidasius]MED4905778.1 S-layer homology domain-containing protein [Parageobacillus thermoglucosidasius]MED4914841.1 S-layer homology domain-containing protein [Parageobacillus thermoglucosidasius]MED4943664.1 S-layer homology domain-containing protein [Parageobacillus thermoglucosidasius]MED4984124.1 S-layer homology domain-containing protein [Parageobacillus thermoglucosidasius]RDE29688.1 S-layer homology domain-containi